MHSCAKNEVLAEGLTIVGTPARILELNFSNIPQTCLGKFSETSWTGMFVRH